MKKFMLLSAILVFLAGCQLDTRSGEVISQPSENKEIPRDLDNQNFATEEVDSALNTENQNTQTYSVEEVAQHNSENDCWTIFEGQVMDLTDYFGHHPDGDRSLLESCGIDSTVIFKRVRKHSQEAYDLLEGMVIGEIK